MSNANRLSISTVAFLIGLGSTPVLAQTATDTTSVTSSTAATTPNMTETLNQNVNNDSINSRAIDRMVDQDLGQQNKIEQGLKDGQLTTAEGARLERGEGRIDNIEAKDLNNGALSHQEQAQLRAAEFGMDGRINRLENNGNTVPTDSTVNNKLIADVQRNINQEQRIDNGVDNQSLKASEVSQLEAGQAKDDRADFRAGRNDAINVNEQQGIRADESGQSMDIRDDRHNSTVATGSVNASMGDRDRDRLASNRSDNDDNRLDRTRDFDHRDFDHDDRMRDRFNNGDHNIDQTNDHDGDDMNHHRFINVGDKDDHGSKGHWSWDHKHNANVAGQSQIGGTAGMKNVAVGSRNSASVTGGNTPLNVGSSTTVAASASTPKVTHVHAPVVTPHVAPPVAHIPVAHSK